MVAYLSGIVCMLAENVKLAFLPRNVSMLAKMAKLVYLLGM